MRNGTASAMVTDAVAADFRTGKAHTAYVYSPHAGRSRPLKILMRKRLFLRNISGEDFFDMRDKTGTRLRSPILGR